MKTYREGAKGALLDEYERAILDLQQVISDISNQHLTRLVDAHTKDEDCRSVQTILSHVVRSGNAYAVIIRNHKGYHDTFPERKFHTSSQEYHQDLSRMFQFTEGIFQEIDNNELEQPDHSKKMMSTWGQLYDIEQLMEHAIVHILRHRRQIEKFKMLLETK